MEISILPKFIALIICIITVCGSSEVITQSRRADPGKFETCKSELGEATNTIQIVKQFVKQVEELIPGFSDPSALTEMTTDMKKFKTELEQLKASIKSIIDERGVSSNHEGGATYTRWGKTTCNGNDTETVYIGQVGGGFHTHSGSSVNYICLPNDPDHAHQLGEGGFDYLYGSEYEIFDNNKPHKMKSGLGDNDVPCAVCRAQKRPSHIMIPGRKRCYQEWSKEYDGYLMAGAYNSAKASEYACVDRNAEILPGGSANQNGALFVPVRVSCGSLKCPPYTEGTDVPCVVCTK